MRAAMDALDLNGLRVAGGRGDDTFRIHRIHRRVRIAMKHDGRPRGSPCRHARTSGLHRHQCARQIRGGAGGEARMNPDGRIDLGVGLSHDRGHRAACRQAGDEDAARIDVVPSDHVLGHVGQDGGFSAAALLMAVLEPVPAALWIHAPRLRRVQDKESLFPRRLVHPGAGGEVVGILRASVQHHHQRQRALACLGRNEELVVAAADRVRETAGDERARAFIGPGGGAR